MRNYEILNDICIKNKDLNPYAGARLKGIKLVLNVNEISSLNDKKLIIPVFNDLIQIMNQRPQTLKAKDSVAAFRIRKNMEIGALVTIRNHHLSFFIKKLQVCLALLSLHPSKSQFGIHNILPLSLSPSSPSSPSSLGLGANFSFLFSSPSFSPLHLRRLGLPLILF